MTGKRRGVRGLGKKADKNYRTRQLLFFFCFFLPTVSVWVCGVRGRIKGGGGGGGGGDDRVEEVGRNGTGGCWLVDRLQYEGVG